MSDISIKQNSRTNIDFLIAQRFFYSKSKKVRNSRLIISVFFALLSPIVSLIFENLVSVLALVSGLWLLTSYVLKKLLENDSLEKAAAIQEEFDTNLFKIPWNNTLVGDKISHECISYAKRKFQGDQSKLKNWYGNISSFPYPLDVLLCQRSNLVWDWRLKKTYSIVIFVGLIAYFIFTILLGVMCDLNLSMYIFGLFLPSLSGYFIGIDEATEHYKASIKREKLESKINILSEKALIRISSLKLASLRELQNSIFEFRKGPLVSDWFYWFFKNTYEEDMRSALENFKRRLSK